VSGVTEHSSNEVQRNTGVSARALVRTTCRHVGAGVDTAWYLFAKRRKKEEPWGNGRGKRFNWIVSLLATTTLPLIAPFLAFLSVHACVSLFLSFSLFPLSDPVTYLLSSNVWTFCLVGNTGYLACYLVEKSTHLARQIYGKWFSARRQVGILFVFFIHFFRWEKSHCLLAQKSIIKK